MNKKSSETCMTERKENMFWGPCYWKTIHTAAASYDPSKRQAFLFFIQSLPFLLPCEKCRAHMRENLQKFPPTNFLGSRDRIFLWSYRFHDIVNRSKEYPTTSPPFEQIKKYYYDGVYSCENCTVL